jgi:DNA processing protein
VVEADDRSGALITARQAIEDHNRTVFAIPGRIDHPTSAGPHKLIREGAVLTENLGDIIDNLTPLPSDVAAPSLFDPSTPPAADRASEPEPTPPTDIGLSDRQALILGELSSDPLHVDGLVERTSLAAHEILQDLTLLTLKGIVKRVDGQTFVRASRASAAR